MFQPTEKHLTSRVQTPKWMNWSPPRCWNHRSGDPIHWDPVGCWSKPGRHKSGVCSSPSSSNRCVPRRNSYGRRPGWPPPWFHGCTHRTPKVPPHGCPIWAWSDPSWNASRLWKRAPGHKFLCSPEKNHMILAMDVTGDLLIPPASAQEPKFEGKVLQPYNSRLPRRAEIVWNYVALCGFTIYINLSISINSSTDTWTSRTCLLHSSGRSLPKTSRRRHAGAEGVLERRGTPEPRCHDAGDAGRTKK